MATIATKVNAKTRDRFSKVILELGTTYARVRHEVMQCSNCTRILPCMHLDEPNVIHTLLQSRCGTKKAGRIDAIKLGVP